MSKIMETTGLGALLGRIAGEYRAKGTIYEIPERAIRDLLDFEAGSPGLEVMGRRIGLPVGPAAGPHSQIAPNLVAAWLCGSRVFELKTVQEKDRLEIEKPCILALDEGHNTEWSTELSLDEASGEYIRGWFAINLLATLWSHRPRDFMFNMSVGYTLSGIRGPRMDAFIEGMRKPTDTAIWKAAMEEFRAFVEGPSLVAAFGSESRRKAAALLADFPAQPIHSVTISTMHGCPPSEIEAIGEYLVVDKGFDTYVKLNPTLLGYDEARRILDTTGWSDISVTRATFEHDLQFTDAIALVGRLRTKAEQKGRRFGIKLSNTLANVNDRRRLPGDERYMSGRALFPITVELAAKLAEALPGFPRRFSYCGGVSALNARELVAAGMGPLTVATDILKPGGYLRFIPIAKAAVEAITKDSARGEGRPDAKALATLAQASLVRPEYKKGFKYHDSSIKGSLPLFDCFAAPCIEACPVGQKVPEYIRLAAEGRNEEALATVLADNPLPCITGTLCDHVCQAACSRNDYEGPVRIREVKLAISEAANIKATPTTLREYSHRVAVIGAGPAGLAAAHYLASEGVSVTVFDRDTEPGGVVANVVPGFRIPTERVKRDIDRIRALGASFRLGVEVTDLEVLGSEGFTRFIVCSGAPSARALRLEGSGIKVIDALEFLALTSKDDGGFAGTRHIVVTGGGNTAMDAVRRSARIKGVTSVRVSYRRAREDMPAEFEEVELALKEALAVAKASGEAAGSLGDVLMDMSSPERLAPGKLTLRRMRAGEPDASGRRAPVFSDQTQDVPCDLLVVAIGETPDAALLSRLGIAVGPDGKPFAEGAEGLARRGVYVAGDAKRGPASIIAAEADGRAAALAIMREAGIEAKRTNYLPPLPDQGALASRGEIAFPLEACDPGFLAREASRCLSCDSACERCVEVCPNRAWFIMPAAPDEASAQILQIDTLCNECGNCGSFCPWEGEPWRDKAALFASARALAASSKAGFAIASDRGLSWRTARDTAVMSLPLDAWYAFAGPLDPASLRMLSMARRVLRDHPYLLAQAPAAEGVPA
jgi:putative selenate reductase